MLAQRRLCCSGFRRAEMTSAYANAAGSPLNDSRGLLPLFEGDASLAAADSERHAAIAPLAMCRFDIIHYYGHAGYF